MILIQFTFRIYHFRLKPNSKFNSFFPCFFYQITNAMRQFGGIFLPVSQSCFIIIAWKFITKPTIIQQKQINSQFFGFAK